MNIRALGYARVSKKGVFALALLAVFAFVGVSVARFSGAAPPVTSSEVENGDRSPAASLIVNASASGGRAVQFSGNNTNGSLTSADLTRLTGLKIYFGHQSVGGNILQGIPEVYSSYGVSGIRMTGSDTSGAGGFLQMITLVKTVIQTVKQLILIVKFGQVLAIEYRWHCLSFAMLISMAILTCRQSLILIKLR